MSDDHSADIQPLGTVAVGGAVRGDIETGGDRDWFAVELVAGRTYTIDLRGSPTGDGTLRDTYLRGIYDANGNWLSGTTNDDGGSGTNSRLTFTATESGTHYVATEGYGSGTGTYELSVRDTDPDTIPESDTTPVRRRPRRHKRWRMRTRCAPAPRILAISLVSPGRPSRRAASTAAPTRSITSVSR